ncbi:MAG: hypothetical protein JST26_01160 [Bacteroidetes bacterium]|nr:hypothetical protein [Bacteroidota bacterium]
MQFYFFNNPSSYGQSTSKHMYSKQASDGGRTYLSEAGIVDEDENTETETPSTYFMESFLHHYLISDHLNQVVSSFAHILSIQSRAHPLYIQIHLLRI